MDKEPQNVDELIEKIHIHVSKMVMEWIEKYLNQKIADLSENTGIPIDRLQNNINIQPSLYQITDCQAKTVLGYQCKYKAMAGNVFCVKHNKKENNIKTLKELA